MSLRKLKLYEKEGTPRSLFFLSFESFFLKAGNVFLTESFSASFFYNGIVLIKGPVGCGKTNLLKILAGLTEPEGTFIHRHVSGMDAECIFIHSQSEFNFITGYVGDELTFAGIDKSQFPHLAGRSVYDMSGGELKKLSVMMALARGGTSVILADEPLDMLDDEESRAVRDFIVNASGERAFIIATHDDLFDDAADVILRFE